MPTPQAWLLSGQPLFKPSFGLYSCGKLVKTTYVRGSAEGQDFLVLAFFSACFCIGQVRNKLRTLVLCYFDATLRLTT